MEMVSLLLSFGKWILIFASTVTFVNSFHIPRFLKRVKLPPGPPTWGPILGNLPQFGSFRTPHVRAQELAKIYGPLMTLKLGIKNFVFVSDPDVAERCFKNNDHIFANRPSVAAQNYVLYGGDHPCSSVSNDQRVLSTVSSQEALAPIGDYWRRARKVYTTELLSVKKLQEFQVLRGEEVTQAVQNIYDKTKSDQCIDLHSTFTKLFTNVITRMTMSRRFFNSPHETASQIGTPNGEPDDSMGKEWQLLIDSNHELMTQILLEDVSPALAWVDLLTGVREKMQKNFDRMDKLLQKVLDDHRAELATGEKNPASFDFIDVLLMLRSDSKTEFLSDREVKAFSLDTVGAASETSMVTSEWAISELLANTEVMEKAQKEVDSIVGKERCVLESDLQNMPYIRALVNETLRLHPPLPWLVPHTNLVDCQLEGYDIPANSFLMFQIWAMQRDPSLWENPLKFDPERFLTTDIDVKSLSVHKAFMPFGAGRRMCPGHNLGLTILQYTLARLIHSFDWCTPDPQVPLDMTERFGLTSLRRASQLYARAQPRLSSMLYR